MGVIPERYNKTESHAVRRLGMRRPGPTAPGDPQEGDVWYETDTDILWVFNGTNWVTQTNFRMAGVADTLLGGAPAINTGPVFKLQGGTQVGSTSLGGDVTVVFPTPFPTGLISLSVIQGDITHPGATFITHSATLSQFVYRMYQANGAVWPSSGAHRVNWMAIGW